MRIIYFDIDALRPDHLGCYGYHRDTSPTIDALAAEGVRFSEVHCSDAPCLPSRTALWSGRFGTHTGVVGHGGSAADPILEGPERGFGSRFGRESWARRLREAGLHTVTISPFAERHGAWHFYAGFNEVHNTGRRGLESAHEIAPVAVDWIHRRGADDGWFLHVQLWDPHTPYRVPATFGHPFAGARLPAWLTEDVRRAHWRGYGPNSAREAIDFGELPAWYAERYPDQPLEIDSMDAVRRLFDGYDRGVRYADDHVALVCEALKDAGVFDEVAILVSADHGENLGELNVYADHHTADPVTTRVPFVMRWPGVTDAQAGRTDRGLYYQFDLAATVLELLGEQVPQGWDARGFGEALRGCGAAGREQLVLTQGAWTCQRAVRWDDYVCIHTRHDGFHGFPEVMLFDVARDPHEQRDLAALEPGVVADGMVRLAAWMAEQRRGGAGDPLDTVMAEGGPAHVRGKLEAYVARLRATGRGAHAEALLARHGCATVPGGGEA